MVTVAEGTPFGRYLLIEQLGQGGMGEVWRAHDTEIDRQVAIKLLLPHFAQDPKFKERFRREARAAARLDDIHVVPIYDIGQIDGRLFVSMKLIDGYDLQTALRAGPLTLAQTVAILTQIAGALDSAHRVGLIHRDIKPSNILITKKGFAYLIDFGIAHVAGEARLTSHDVALGTWAYMSPERFSAGLAEASSDVYALACVLYQCLTAELPYPAVALEQIAVAHMTATPPRPSANTKVPLPSAIDAVIATGLAKNPAHRYPTATDLLAAAESALTDSARVYNDIRKTFDPEAPLSTTTFSALHPRAFETPKTPAEATTPAPTPPPPKASRSIPQVPLHRPPGKRTPPATAVPKPAAAPQPAPAAAPQSTPQLKGIPFPRKPFIIFCCIAIVVAIANVSLVVATDPGLQPNANTRAPVEQSALEGLLLSPHQMNTTIDTNGLAVTDTWTKLSDISATDSGLSDWTCQPVLQAGVVATFTGSGWTAARGQMLDQAGEKRKRVVQFVVSFASADEASAFFLAAPQRWAACADRQFTLNTTSGNQVWTVGPVNNSGDTLSVNRTNTSDDTGSTADVHVIPQGLPSRNSSCSGPAVVRVAGRSGGCQVLVRPGRFRGR